MPEAYHLWAVDASPTGVGHSAQQYRRRPGSQRGSQRGDGDIPIKERHLMFQGRITSPSARRRAWRDSLFIDHAVFRLVWTNVAPVVPGKVWRCNHPTPSRLRRLTRALHLRTLVNLRGHRQCGSDALSRAAAERIGLTHLDMAFESRGAPHRERILRFYDLYRTMAFPMLMHCKSGADRAGLASGLVLMFEGGTASDALGQLHWRFGHFSRSRTGILDAFFLRYQTQAEGRVPFIDWVRDEYDENRLRADFKAGKLASFVNDSLLRRE